MEWVRYNSCFSATNVSTECFDNSSNGGNHLTDDNGDVVYEQNFDPWGRKRNPGNWTYDLAAYTQPTLTTGWPDPANWLNRGYTGHEHLDEFALINMTRPKGEHGGPQADITYNRMYDPIAGRMLAVDNFVVDANSTQAYNRYSYAANNPMVFTDPTGEIPWFVPLKVRTTNRMAGALNGTLDRFTNSIYNKESITQVITNTFWGGAEGVYAARLANQEKIIAIPGRGIKGFSGRYISMAMTQVITSVPGLSVRIASYEASYWSFKGLGSSGPLAYANAFGAAGAAPPFYGWAINKFSYTSAVINPLFFIDP